MAFSVKTDEPLARALKRVAREEVNHAIAELTGGEDRHEAIHEARKSIKKLRALLRLLEPQLGATATNAGRRLRDLGRTLSALRDTAALVETFDQMAVAHPAEMGLNRFAAVRGQLVDNRDKAAAASDDAALAANAAGVFRKMAPAINLWRLHGEGFPLVAPGFEASYRAGRKALRRAQEKPSTDNFHEFRKRAKDHWYHVRLLGALWPGSSDAYEKTMRGLQETLGDANNVSVLLRADVGLLKEIAQRWRDQLRAQALETAALVYASSTPPAASA